MTGDGLGLCDGVDGAKTGETWLFIGEASLCATGRRGLEESERKKSACPVESGPVSGDAALDGPERDGSGCNGSGCNGSGCNGSGCNGSGCNGSECTEC
jgi:hypothetical protein